MADKNSLCALPLSRVKTIMKSSPDVSSISQEALFLTGKATVKLKYVHSIYNTPFIVYIPHSSASKLPFHNIRLH